MSLCTTSSKLFNTSNRKIKFNIPGFCEQREFNFVLLKDSYFRERYIKIYELLKQAFYEIRHGH